MHDILCEGVAPNTKRVYQSVYNTYDSFYKNELIELGQPILYIGCILAYCLNMFQRGLKASSLATFITSVDIRRAACGMPGVTNHPMVVRLRKSFKKRSAPFVIDLPTLGHFDTVITGLTRRTIPPREVICILAFLLASVLALRTGEVWVLSPIYIDRKAWTITWPEHLIGHGIKSGLVRKINKWLANDLLELYFAFPYPPFTCLDRGYCNEIVSKHFGCTLQAARHVGANTVYRTTKDMKQVQKTLGHAGPDVSMNFYIDKDFPDVQGKLETAIHWINIAVRNPPRANPKMTCMHKRCQLSEDDLRSIADTVERVSGKMDKALDPARYLHPGIWRQGDTPPIPPPTRPKRAATTGLSSPIGKQHKKR